MQSPLCMHLLSVLTFCNRDCESQYSAQCFEYCNAVRSSSVNVISYIGTYITNTCLRSNICFHRYNNWHGCEYFLLFVDDPGWPQQQKYSFTLDGPIHSYSCTFGKSQYLCFSFHVLCMNTNVYTKTWDEVRSIT